MTKNKQSTFLCVSVYDGVARTPPRRTIQNIVNKYTFAIFNCKSPHKLRHSFAVNYICSGGDITLLLRSDIKTTSLILTCLQKMVKKSWMKWLREGSCIIVYEAGT